MTKSRVRVFEQAQDAIMEDVAHGGERITLDKQKVSALRQNGGE